MFLWSQEETVQTLGQITCLTCLEILLPCFITFLPHLCLQLRMVNCMVVAIYKH